MSVLQRRVGDAGANRVDELGADLGGTGDCATNGNDVGSGGQDCLDVANRVGTDIDGPGLRSCRRE
jgi:hypothetical protein